jgi:lipopolysaccharide export system protein LptC
MRALSSGGKPGAPAPAVPLSPRQMLIPSRERTALSVQQIARRRLAVRLAKRVLPGLALLLLAAIVLWPEFERSEDRSRYAFRRSIQPRSESLRVTAPRYQGVDDLNRPYTVTADLAQQVGAEEQLDLTQPRADILMTDGSWIYLQSETGRYDRPRDHLDLAGKVTIFHDNGTMLVTDGAAVDLAAGNGDGDKPVAAQGPFGTLTSEGFALRERGAVVIFTGRAHAVLEGERK